MHDTSNESISRWKAVGAKRNDFNILGPSSTLQAKRQSRKYRPSKQREISNSKIFNRNKSRIESLDSIPKEDLNDSTLKEAPALKSRRAHNSEEINAPIIRVNSESTFLQAKDLAGIERISRVQRKSSFGAEKQLIVLKDDYNRFKQKVLNQLEIQKQNITKIVNQILQSVRSQLAAIEEKYANNSNLKIDRPLSAFPALNLPQFTSQTPRMKLTDISMISNISQGEQARNPSEKAIINELKQLKSVQDDPITQRFSKFYSAIEKLKSDLDCLHEISSANHPEGDVQGVVPMTTETHVTKQNRQGQGLFSVLKV